MACTCKSSLTPLGRLVSHPCVGFCVCRKVSAFANREWPMIRASLETLPTVVKAPSSKLNPTAPSYLGKRRSP
jgi:hypothetical protein